MIATFKDPATQKLFETGPCRKIAAEIRKVSIRKLTYLDAAEGLHELLEPPGNHLEALKGDRLGQHSIRINDKYRICFVWRGHSAYEVEIVDYH
jgi:toxin HigB-1